jgi:hypothetical protein
MARVGIETIPEFERARIVHALDRAATVIGEDSPMRFLNENKTKISFSKFRPMHNFLLELGGGEYLNCCHISFHSIAFSTENIVYRLKFYRGTTSPKSSSSRNRVMVFVGAYFRTSYTDINTVYM